MLRLADNVSPRPTTQSAVDLIQNFANQRGRLANQEFGIPTKVNNLTNVDNGQYLPSLNERISLAAVNGAGGGAQEDQSFNRTSNKPKSAAPGKRRGIKNQLSPKQTMKPQYLTNTIQQQQRVANIGVSEQANNISFEARLKEIYHVKDSAVKLNPKVIETWINETLLDAEHLDIPGVVLKPEHKNPISRYQIDRLTLTNSGIPNEYVDRIYRGLFVYSIGFYEMLQRSLHHADSKYTLLSSIWKVFAILLEYCCKSNYQMLISKLSKEHKEEIEKLEKEFVEQVQRLSENERNLKDVVEDLQKRKDDLQKQMEEEAFLRKKIEEEFTRNIQSHEEEVQLRLKFEQKLNNMHALHRDLQAKYQRSLEDIYQLETQNHHFSRLVSEQKSELIELRSEKVENESKIVYQAERIKQLIQENELKLRQINDIELKLNKANQEIESKQLSLKTAEKQCSEMRLKLDANQSLIDSLTSEKNHLDLTLKENRDQKEQFKEKCERLQKLYEDVFQEMQEYKKQLVGVQEIKKDRDDRIEKLREEYDSIFKKHDKLDKEHTSLKIHHEHISEEYENLKLEFESVSERLRLSNKARNEKEDILNEKLKIVVHLQDTVKDKDYQLDKNKKEIDKLQKRLIDVERQNDQLEIKKKSLDKQSEIQRKQLLDKVQNLNELVSAEKDTREMWINRYEKEQKSHIATNTELLTTKGLLQDANLKTQNLQIVIDSLSKSRDQTKDSNESLQTQITDLIAKIDQTERDLYTKTELLRTVEEQQRIYVRKLRDEHQRLVERNEHQMLGKDMEYEDLRSYCRQLFIANDTLKVQKEHLIAELSKTTEHRDTLITNLAKLQIQFDELTIKYGQLSDQLKESEEKCVDLDFQCSQYARQVDGLQEEVEVFQKMEEDYRLLQHTHHLTSEKLAILESSFGGTDGEAIRRGNKTFMNRGLQTKKIKQKERNIQTDFIQQTTQLTMLNQQMPPQQVLFSTTQASTKHSANSLQRKPRIASAVNTTTTMGMSNGALNRDPSQGLASTLINSQNEGFNYLDYGSAGNMIGYNNVGSGSNISDYDHRAIRSAAHKYRHMVPGTEAIEEEAENVTRLGPTNGNNGMFRRNSALNGEDEDSVETQQQQMRGKTPTAGAASHSFIRQDTNNSKQILSGTSQPTALQKHQQASRQGLKNNYMDEPGLEGLKKQSTHSSKRSGEIKEEVGTDVLRSVYERRVTQTGIQKSAALNGRPLTQPGQNRITSAGFSHQLTINGGELGGPETIMTPSDSSHIQRLRLENQQYQNNLMQHTTNSAKSKSNDRFSTKGKTSIKNLIKVATARE